MSRVVHINVTCPFCGHDQTESAYTSVNATLDPYLRTKLFDDNLNTFTCLKCEMISLISINLLYHDMDRQFGVWYCPQGDIPEVVKRSFESLNQMPGVGDYLFRAPATYSWEEFKSAITKFEGQKASAVR
jgi:hypothetical protein